MYVCVCRDEWNVQAVKQMSDWISVMMNGSKRSRLLLYNFIPVLAQPKWNDKAQNLGLVTCCVDVYTESQHRGCWGYSAQSWWWLTYFCQSGPQSCILGFVGGCRMRGRSGCHSNTTGTAPALPPMSPVGFHPNPERQRGKKCIQFNTWIIPYLGSLFAVLFGKHPVSIKPLSGQHCVVSASERFWVMLWYEANRGSVDCNLLNSPVIGTLLKNSSLHRTLPVVYVTKDSSDDWWWWNDYQLQPSLPLCGKLKQYTVEKYYVESGLTKLNPGLVLWSSVMLWCLVINKNFDQWMCFQRDWSWWSLMWCSLTHNLWSPATGSFSAHMTIILKVTFFLYELYDSFLTYKQTWNPAN